jgi:hypothetical protein
MQAGGRIVLMGKIVETALKIEVFAMTPRRLNAEF